MADMLWARSGGAMNRASSLQSFKDYKQSESRNVASSVDMGGNLLEYETLELRLHPPNVVIDNESSDDATIITIDSANRPGTLIEVVQCLTELGLSIRRARISSDGGWFVDEFHVTETPKGRVQDPRKLALIKKLLSVDMEAHQSGPGSLSCTVFELSGKDKSGLLASVLQLMVSSGCDVVSAAVWTFHKCVALVVAVTENGVPIQDGAKLSGLEDEARFMLGGEEAEVVIENVRGEIHHERRLHHLLLVEEQKFYEQQEKELRAIPSGGVCLDETLRGWRSFRLDDSTTPSPDPTVIDASNVASAVDREDSVTSNQSSQPPMQRSQSHASTSSLATGVGGGGAANGPDRAITPPLSKGGAEDSTGPECAPSPSSTNKASVTPMVPRVGSTTTSPGFPSFVPAPTAALSSDILHMGSWSSERKNARVKIQDSPMLRYWLVTIVCGDRNKLFFDTVCTLADMNYDVYHGTIDSEGDVASQLFYVRPRYGEAIWDEHRAHKLKYMLESAVQRRFPRGSKLHVEANERCLPHLFTSLSTAGFSITRAEANLTHQDNAVYNLSLTDVMGKIPTTEALQHALSAAGGHLDLDLLTPSSELALGMSNVMARHGPGEGVPKAVVIPANCKFAFRFVR